MTSMPEEMPYFAAGKTHTMLGDVSAGADGLAAEVGCLVICRTVAL